MKAKNYSDYNEVPWYFKQWFFWVTYFTLTPVALGILLFGNVYYIKKGQVVSFGIANKIIAGIIGAIWIINMFSLISK